MLFISHSPHHCHIQSKWKHCTMMISLILQGQSHTSVVPVTGTGPQYRVYQLNPHRSQLICAEAWGKFLESHLAKRRPVLSSLLIHILLAHRKVAHFLTSTLICLRSLQMFAHRLNSSNPSLTSMTKGIVKCRKCHFPGFQFYWDDWESQFFLSCIWPPFLGKLLIDPSTSGSLQELLIAQFYPIGQYLKFIKQKLNNAWSYSYFCL